MKDKVFQIITDRVIAAIEEKQELLWTRTWSVNNIPPQNYDSKRPYHGINKLLLSFIHPSTPYFLTFNQIKKVGAKLNKGSKSIPVIYWMWTYIDEDGNKVKDRAESVKQIPFLRYYNVFSIDDTDIEYEIPEYKVYTDNEKIELCDRIVESHEDLKLVHENKNRAFYKPFSDFINMPPLEAFKTSEAYYATLFHEMTHWTGHKNRLDRLKLEVELEFKKIEYSKEELVAEMGSTFLCDYTQISNEALVNNSVAYIKGWIKALKNDPKMLVYAASQAQKACDLIISKVEIMEEVETY